MSVHDDDDAPLGVFTVVTEMQLGGLGQKHQCKSPSGALTLRSY